MFALWVVGRKWPIRPPLRSSDPRDLRITAGENGVVRLAIGRAPVPEALPVADL